MLQLKKSITSKSVILLIIFLTTTTFGFMEKTNRNHESRRSFRERSVSMDKHFTEEMPYRRDTSRRANEKDIIYENLYDRRSFRTGTDRQIRNQDRERISNIQDRNLETFSNRYRHLDNHAHQDKSRLFTQNDRTIHFDRTNDHRRGIDTNKRNMRQQREERVLGERNIRENTERELPNRKNVNIRSKYLSREQNVNKNEFVSRRYEATQNLRLDRNLRVIPARSFRGEGYPQQETNSQRHEDRQQSRRSLSRFSQSVETPVNHERNLKNRERRFLDNDRKDNRRQNERFVDKRVVQVTRNSSGLRLVNFYREARERLPMTVQDVQNVRELRSREQRNREGVNRSSRKFQNDNISENRENRESRESRIRDERNRTPSTDRFSRVIRDDSRRTSRFVLGTSENRYRNERYLGRDRAVPDRELTSRNDAYRASLSRSDSTRQILEARINSQPIRTDTRLPTAANARHRVSEMRSLKSIDRRLVPVVEYSSNTGRTSDRIVDVKQSETLTSNFKFDCLANVIQVILGVYLIRQIFAHSSKKNSFRYQRLFPSLSSVKDKFE